MSRAKKAAPKPAIAPSVPPAAPTPRPPKTIDFPALLATRLALRVSEVAEGLGVSSATVRNMISSGELPGRKVGGGTESSTYVVPVAGLKAWLDGAAAPATGPR